MRKDHLFLWSISLLVFPIVVYVMYGTIEHIAVYYIGTVVGGGPSIVITHFVLKRFDFVDYLFVVGGVSVSLVLLGIKISSVVITLIGIFLAVYPIAHTTYSMFYADDDGEREGDYTEEIVEDGDGGAEKNPDDYSWVEFEEVNDDEADILMPNIPYPEEDIELFAEIISEEESDEDNS